MFAGVGSIVGGLIVELMVLWEFRETNFVQIGYKPLLYVGLLGFIPALLTGTIIALKQVWYGENKSMLTTFLTGFMMSALYMGIIVIYLGITTVEEVGLLFVFMMTTRLFSDIKSSIASIVPYQKYVKRVLTTYLKKTTIFIKVYISLDDYE